MQLRYCNISKKCWISLSNMVFKFNNNYISETWTPTGENLDLEIRRPNEDLATNTDQFSKFDRSLDWRF